MAILAFHNTGKGFYPGLNNCSPKRLEKLLAGLIDTGYEFISMADYLESSTNIQSVSLTFDDGYTSFFEYAWPILKKENIPATVFIPYGYVGKKAGWDYLSGLQNNRHLSREQIRELSDGGIEIGSHGFSHIDLAGLNDRMLRLELERSKKGLEDLIGKEVKYISYPFGRFNGYVESEAAGLGYERGFSLSFFNKSRSGFSIPRFAVYTTDSLYAVDKKLSCGFGCKIEKFKGAIMNAYSYGTIILNKFQTSNRPEYY